MRKDQGVQKGLFICGAKIYFGYEAKGVFTLQATSLKEQEVIKAFCTIEGKFSSKCYVYITESGVMKIVQAKNSQPNLFVSKSSKLSYFGRKMIVNHEALNLIVIESQSHVLSTAAKESKLSELKQHS